MLTTEQLNAIKERAEKATAGPWIWVYPPGRMPALSSKTEDGEWIMEFGDPELFYPQEGQPPNLEDAEFIAHAREDIPALLQSIDELKKALLDTTDESDTFRENLKTIEKLTECETTRDFATRALKGEATLRIGVNHDD